MHVEVRVELRLLLIVAHVHAIDAQLLLGHSNRVGIRDEPGLLVRALALAVGALLHERFERHLELVPSDLLARLARSCAIRLERTHSDREHVGALIGLPCRWDHISCLVRLREDGHQRLVRDLASDLADELASEFVPLGLLLGPLSGVEVGADRLVADVGVVAQVREHSVNVTVREREHLHVSPPAREFLSPVEVAALVFLVLVVIRHDARELVIGLELLVLVVRL